MNNLRRLPLLLITLLFWKLSFSQCGLAETITKCDMELIDFDTDGTPDGIIDLFIETGITPQTGDIWESTGSESVEAALDPTTGIVRLWKLRNASSGYEVTLRNTSCAPSNRARVQLILGPYAGKPATTGFYSVCDVDVGCTPEIEIDINLFETLETKEDEAPPHLNGFWEYTGSLPDSEYILIDSNFGATIPYSPEDGSPVDSEDFTFRYVVPSTTLSCATEIVDVQITLIRAPFGGNGSQYNICITDESWDRTINLNDDEFLVREDLDGTWAFISDGGTPIEISREINLKDYIDDFLNAPDYEPGFGCKEFQFRYTVPSRAPVCTDGSGLVVFRIFEELKEFEQENSPEEICPATDSRTSLDLYDLITFQPGFEYQNGESGEETVRWSFENGPSDLNLIENINNLEIPEKHRGPITIQDAIPGLYEFRYTVSTDTLCDNFAPQSLYINDGCDLELLFTNPCGGISAPVIVEILDFDYAGENTTLTLCSSDYSGDISLRSFLQNNGTPIATGEWTDTETGDVIDDLFTFPENITSSITFSFTHTTSNLSGCIDVAILEFTLFNDANAGDDTNVSVSICSDDLTITLFDQLTGNPDTTGTWTGPFGYQSDDHLGIFNADDTTLPILGPGEYVYTVAPNAGCGSTATSIVTILIIDPIEIGQDVNETFCILDGRVNLYSLLDSETIRTGIFEDTENTGALTPEGVVEFDLLPNPDNQINPIYNFRYVVENTAPCDESSLNVAVQIIDLPEPIVPDQEFCILDAARLENIEVDVTNYNWYETLESGMPIIDNPILLDEQVFYIANVDADNCESERVMVTIAILNLGERLSDGSLCTLDFQDGVSPDGNNQNDTFDLNIEGNFNIPEAFPDFVLKVYNRYGSIVYEGNRNTEEFRGASNTSLTLGDDLPSGTYFYVFEPNFKENQPIQGSFYLGR